jgi:hypothetical protein
MRLLGAALVLASILLGAGGIAFRLVGDASASESSRTAAPPAGDSSSPGAVCRVAPSEPLVIDLDGMAEKGRAEGVIPLNTRGYNYGYAGPPGPQVPPARRAPPASPERSTE